MFTKVQRKQSVEILKQLRWILPYIFVIGLWVHFCILNSVPFWQISDDYPWHLISHALSIESSFLVTQLSIMVFLAILVYLGVMPAGLLIGWLN